MEEQTNNIVEKKTNGFAIAGFILSFIFTILGLIFSIIGLCFVKKYQSGKGLSIAGIIICCIKIILSIIFIFIAPFVLVGWMTEKFGPEFEEQFTKSYCETMSTQKEACTLKEDGTYDCIVVTCDFDNVKESKEEKEDPNKKEEKVTDKEDSKDEKKPSKKEEKDTEEENITILYDNKGNPSKEIEYKNNAKEYVSDFYHNSGNFVFADYDELYYTNIKEYDGFKIQSDGTLSTGLSKDFEKKYYKGLSDIKFVSLVPYFYGDVGIFSKMIALSTTGDIYMINTGSEEYFNSLITDGIHNIPSIFYEKINYNKQGIEGKITELGTIPYTSDLSPFVHNIITVNGKKYIYNPKSQESTLKELTDDLELFNVIYAGQDGYYELRHSYNGEITINDKIMTDVETSKPVLLKYALSDTRNTPNGKIYIVSKDNKIYYVDNYKKNVFDYMGYVKKITVNKESLEVSLTNGETISIK